MAEDGTSTPLGATWYRLFAAEAPGYGFVSESIPELAIGVVEEARGQGIGAALLAGLVVCARREGHPALSLSVELANPARRLYERTGFVRTGGDDEADTLLLELGPSSG